MIFLYQKEKLKHAGVGLFIQAAIIWCLSLQPSVSHLILVDFINETDPGRQKINQAIRLIFP